LRNRLGLLAAVGLVLARFARSWWQRFILLARTRHLVAYEECKTFHFTGRKGQCTVTVRKHLPKRFTIQFAEATQCNVRVCTRQLVRDP